MTIPLAKPKRPHVLVLAGPTAVGKTAASIALAQAWGCSIVSADARQCYRELAIGSAPPSAEELALAPHYFIADRSVSEPLTAAGYAREARKVLARLMDEDGVAIVVGGSGLYLQALLDGLDDLPVGYEKLRADLQADLKENGIAALAERLILLDPDAAKIVDLANPRRVLRALEICLATGKPYSRQVGQVGQSSSPLPWPVTRLCLTMDRPELYGRIDRRVLDMVAAGLQAEAEALYPLRHLPALQTVGYREVFAHMDGLLDWPVTVAAIQQNTRRYAKRQMTWFRNQGGYTMMDARSLQAGWI